MCAKKTNQSRSIKKHAKGRVCKKYGCHKRLSIYNADEYCYVHRMEGLSGDKK